ncbi:uncharacterized protein LOC134217025 [Armigeres subalbatus]|uniref:uncharacterized protein LOC134217025 n=1 Tax=Armigeres subalbatus TaxID=124917 RepID=UPI002ED3FDDD
MEVISLVWQFVVSVVIIQVVVAEECIRLQDHMNELEKCCSYTPPYPRDGIGKCSKQAAEKSGTDKVEYLSCIFECYFDRLGLVVDNTLHLDKVSEHLQSMSEDVRSTVIAAYKKCDAETTGSQRVCHSYAQELEACTLIEISRLCPDELYNPSEICDKRRAGAEICSS